MSGLYSQKSKRRPSNVHQFKRRGGGVLCSPRRRRAARWPWALLLASPLIGIGIAWAWTSDSASGEGTESFFSAEPVIEQYGVTFSECGSGARYNCVVDGDTLWLEGEKIRIADINTPEVSSPECAREAQLGAQATDRLIALLNEGAFSLETVDRDVDRYGRKLRIVTRSGESLGSVLVDDGLAEEWKGRRKSWC